MKKSASIARQSTTFVWPIKCHSICVIVPAHLGSNFHVHEATSGAATETSGTLPELFSETLLAASRASSESARVNDSASDSSGKTARRQRSASEEVKAPNAASDGHADVSATQSQPTLPQQQVLPLQQTEETNRDAVAVQALAADAESSLALPGAGNQGTKTPTLPLGDTANRASDAVGNATPGAPSQAAKDTDANSGVNADSEKDPRAPQNAVANTAQNSVANVVSNALLNGQVGPALHAALNVSLRSAAATGNATPGAPSQAAKDTDAHSGVNADSEKDPQAPQNAVVNTAQNSVANVVLNADLNGQVGPVLHAALNASLRSAAASKLSAPATDQAVPAASTPDQAMLATNASVPNVTADQLVSPAQQGGGILGATRADGSSLNSASTANSSTTSVVGSKDGSKNATSDATGLKQHAQPVSDQTGMQADFQPATQSGNQSQSGGSSQGQNTAPAPVSFANHAVAAVSNAQSTPAASPAPSGSEHGGAAASAARTQENAASASPAALQSPPVINTAKLIQTMGQSEMRVGMHSNEFGSISISTSSTRDSISAQISLDHGELAKAIAAHLPEMQARMGGNQAVDVRIDMNSNQSGQGAGTPGSMANSSSGQSGQSHGSRQQSGNSAPSYMGNGVVETPLSSASAATGYGTLNARLDVRV